MSILHNIKWAAFSQLARIGSQIASVTLLARLLSPSDYGLLAIAAIFTNFAMLFRDFGTGSALIQRETLTEGLKASVFWLNMALGGLICLTLMAASPAVAHFYDAPTLVPVLCLMALSFPVACSSIVHQSLLERASQFKRIAAVESVAVVLALLAAVGAALAGWGVYALVAQTLVAATVQGAMLWAMSDWRPAPRPRWDGLREISGYSGNVSAFQFVNYFARNADSFIIGKVLGSAVLGLYSVAYRLMLFPVQNISHVVARAVFPLLTQAHQQGGRAQMAEVYLRSLGVITFGTAPVMAALWFFREPTVAVVFGVAGFFVMSPGEAASDGGVLVVPLDPPLPAPPLPGVTGPSGAPLVVIDAGHGGHDPGARAESGEAEKDLTLAVARAIRDALAHDGRVRVALTREDDRFLVLGERFAIARGLGADLFLSIHADSAGSEDQIAGASIYTLSLEASSEAAARFAARENAVDTINGVALSGQSDTVNSILVELSQRRTQADSAEFAGLIAREGKGVLQFHPQARRSAGLAVLRAPDVPSVLYEAGFVSNPEEADRLASPEGREKFARVLARAIRIYFARQSNTG